MEVNQGDASSAAVTAVVSDTNMRKVPGVTAAEGGSHPCILSWGRPFPHSRPSPFLLGSFLCQPKRHAGKLGKGRCRSHQKWMWSKIVLCHFHTKSVIKNKGGRLAVFTCWSFHCLIMGQKPGEVKVLCPEWGLSRSGQSGHGRPRGAERGSLLSAGRRSFAVQAGVQLGLPHHAVEGARVGLLAHLLAHVEGGPGCGAGALQCATPLS